jgi:hypothetical protein
VELKHLIMGRPVDRDGNERAMNVFRKRRALDPKSADSASGSGSSAAREETRAILITGSARGADERHDVEGLFLDWAWNVDFCRDWNGAVRLLARALRGLERAGLIERRTIRRQGHRPHHAIRLTPLGDEALVALRADWIEGGKR